MQLSKRSLLDFILGFIGSGMGGLIYSVFAGEEFDLAFNVLLGTALGGLCAVRLHKRRLTTRVQQSIPADA